MYVTLLEGGRGAGRGRVVALRQRNGNQRWSRTLPSRSESSPLLHDGRLYFGSENGTLYCLDADNGKVIWTYRAAGAIKGSPTLAHGKLFFGDYGGHVQAVRASNGHRVWSVGGAGRIYATAAVAAAGSSSAACRGGFRPTRPGPGGACGRARPGATSTPRRR